MPNCKLILVLSHARRSCGFECHHDEKDQAVAFQFISGRAGRTSFPLLSLTCWHQECTSLPGEFIVFFVFKRARQSCRSPESCLFFFLPLPVADLVSPAAGDVLPLPSHASAVHGLPIPKLGSPARLVQHAEACSCCSIVMDRRSCFKR